MKQIIEKQTEEKKKKAQKEKNIMIRERNLHMLKK